MSDVTREIVLKAWDRYQSLIAELGDACWKIRSLFYTVSFGVIAAAFSLDLSLLYLLNIVLALLFCILEAGYERIQAQYIAKTLSIERTINDILAGEELPWLPNYGITTGLQNLSIKALLRAFRPKKYLFWLSYLAVIVVSLVLSCMQITKSTFSSSGPNPCVSNCCCKCQ